MQIILESYIELAGLVLGATLVYVISVALRRSLSHPEEFYENDTIVLLDYAKLASLLLLFLFSVAVVSIVTKDIWAGKLHATVYWQESRDRIWQMTKVLLIVLIPIAVFLVGWLLVRLLSVLKIRNHSKEAQLNASEVPPKIAKDRGFLSNRVDLPQRVAQPGGKRLKIVKDYLDNEIRLIRAYLASGGVQRQPSESSSFSSVISNCQNCGKAHSLDTLNCHNGHATFKLHPLWLLVGPAVIAYSFAAKSYGEPVTRLC